MTDKAPLFVKFDGKVFRPLGRFDDALAAKFRRDVPLEATIKEKRSLPRQRLYWSVLQAVVDATGKWANVEALHYALKLHTGYIDEVASLDGEVLITARSTSFGKMDESAFREYFDTAMHAIVTDVTPGLTVEDLLALGQARLGGQAA